MVDHAQVAAGRLDVTALDTREADDVVEDLVVVAGIGRDAQELRVAAETREFRLQLGDEAVARVLARCRASCS